MESAAPLPARLAAIVEAFASAPPRYRLEALLDFSKRLAPPPPTYHREHMQAVPECQTPFYLAVEVGGQGDVTLIFDVPAESPTVRGYAGILQAGLEGVGLEEILAVPNDFYLRMGLEEVVSSLRLRGMGAILARLKSELDKHRR